MRTVKFFSREDYPSNSPDGEDVLLLWGTLLIEGALYKVGVKGAVRLNVPGFMPLKVRKYFSVGRDILDKL